MSPKFMVLCTPPNEFGGGTEPILLEFTRDGIPVPLAYARGTDLTSHVREILSHFPEIPSGHVSHVPEIPVFPEFRYRLLTRAVRI